MSISIRYHLNKLHDSHFDSKIIYSQPKKIIFLFPFLSL